MELLDQAQQVEEQRRADALRDHALKPKMAFNGECYNCTAELEQGLFCDKDCRDDYEARIKLQGINGHV